MCIQRFDSLLTRSIQSRHISTNTIAKACNRSKSTVRRWINGTQTPGRLELKILGNLLEQDEAYFLQSNVVYTCKPRENS